MNKSVSVMLGGKRGHDTQCDSSGPRPSATSARQAGSGPLIAEGKDQFR